jgi:DNA-binding CsgD family transcriptional regulator
MSGRSDTVSIAELRRLLRLAGELRELPFGSPEQRRHALEGLGALVGAPVGLWLDLDGFLSARPVIRNALDIGWSGVSERDVFLRYCQDQTIAVDPSLEPIARTMHGPFYTPSRRQVVDDRTWYRSEHVQEFRRAARVDDFIYGGHLTDDGDRAQGFSLHRPWGERPFSERERRLVHAFHLECRWLYERPSPVPAAVLAALPPRLRETLCGLARGLGEKQLADELGLSPHTVHEYVKALHRRFHASSRAELLARCRDGESTSSRGDR